MTVFPSKVLRISKSDHIVGKYDRTHSCQCRASVLLIGTLSCTFRAAVVAMRTKYAGVFALVSCWSVQVAVDKKTGPRFEGGRLHCVAVVMAFVLDDRVQGRALGQRAKLGSIQELFSNRRCTLFPLGEIGVCRGQSLELCHGFGLGVIVALAEGRLVGRLRSVNWVE